MDFTGIVSYNNVQLLKLSPYGAFDVGAYNGTSLLGGTPQVGIAEGESAIFTFNVELTQAGEDATNEGLFDLTEYKAFDFLGLYSHKPSGNHAAVNFVVRWQDYLDDESGKLLIHGPGEVIPEPVSMLLFGTAMAAGVAVGIKKRKKQAS